MVLIIAPLAILLVAGFAWVSLTLGTKFTAPALADSAVEIPLNPFEAVVGVANGSIPWPWQSTAIAITLGVILVALAFVGAVALGRRRGKQRGVDTAAKTMGRVKDLRGITGRDAEKKSARLTTATSKDARTHGLLLGRTISSPAVDIRMSWEDTLVMFAGQRMGKTSAIVATSILGAPGPCLATANKGDIVDITRPTREGMGRVWCFDLQGIAGDGGANFWFNPLAPIKTVSDARRTASYFVGASTDASARVDAYFDGGARELLALSMLAAAVAGGDLLHVKTWLGADHDETPSNILRINGHTDAAARLRQTSQLNSRQKDGLYDMARRFLDVLADSNYAAAVTPQQRKKIIADDREVTTEYGERLHSLEEFDPTAFVTSTDTMYALSTSRLDSPAALTTALVGRILDAGQEVARKQEGRQLPIPLVAVLDEAANVVKLEELPALYSYLGSQGIVPMTFLQSKAQAEKVWGREGVEAMVSSSNFHIYGGGIDDDRYLDQLSKLVGHHRVASSSTSSSTTGGSRSQQWSRERILDVEDLAAMPVDRCLIMSSGNSPVLASKVFWQESGLAVATEKAG